MIGFPACGKSYLRNLLLQKINDIYYYNNDDIKDKVNNNKLCTTIQLCNNKNKIINDNTNLTIKNRNMFFDKLSNYYKVGIYFDYDLEINLHLNYYRMYNYDKPLINKMIYNKLNKDFHKPSVNEFDKYFIFYKIFPSFKSKIKYLF